MDVASAASAPFSSPFAALIETTAKPMIYFKLYHHCLSRLPPNLDKYGPRATVLHQLDNAKLQHIVPILTGLFEELCDELRIPPEAATPVVAALTTSSQAAKDSMAFSLRWTPVDQVIRLT
jgi:hypothetical protein